MDVTEEWWSEHCKSGGEEEEGAVEIDCKYLTHVADIQVSAPWGRDRNNLDCYIYGHISFNVGLSDEPVTLFHRRRDNPDLLRFTGQYPRCYIPLTDGHKGERALGAVTKSNPLYLNMKLYEKKGSLQEDELMANVENFKYYDPHHLEDYSAYWSVRGESGFGFRVRYTIVFGVRAEVKVRIDKKEGDFPNREVPMWGDIGAWQYLTEPSPGYPNSVSKTTLLNIHESEEVTYNVGKPIELERRFVVAPMQYEKYLGITFTVATDSESPDLDDDGETILEDDVYFPFPLSFDDELYSFKTNKDLTHTKHIEHSLETSFSVSIKFVRP